MFKPLVIVPFYNHLDGFAKIAERLCGHRYPVLLIDDGSSREQSEGVKKLCSAYGIEYLACDENKGKGAAMKKGFAHALAGGYTNVLQIDADGQHDTGDIPKFMALAEKNPDALINGCPVYDETVPAARLYGRRITDFWVAVETGGRKIADSMCGFRVYPLAGIKDILPGLFCERMGFDIEIIVKCCWKKMRIINQPTKVYYPRDGVSHFKMLADNVRISFMHTRLCFSAFINFFKRLFHGSEY